MFSIMFKKKKKIEQPKDDEHKDVFFCQVCCTCFRDKGICIEYRSK